MSKHSVIRKPRIETYRGKAGPCGVEVNTRARDNGKLGRPLGAIAINLRSGLFDPGSASFEDFAAELYDYGKGNFVVSTIGTNYPKLDVVRMWRGLKDARLARSKSTYKAIKHVNAKYRPVVAVQLGQSEGGITVADGTNHWVKHNSGLHIPAATALVTMDTPLVHEAAEKFIEIPETLTKLGINCLPDMMQIGPKQWAAMTKANVRHKTSIWDIAYGVAEIGYLSQGVDLRPQFGELQAAGISVWNISHINDMVKNTVIVEGQSREFAGGHARFMREPMPVIEYMGGIVSHMLEEAGIAPEHFGLSSEQFSLAA